MGPAPLKAGVRIDNHINIERSSSKMGTPKTVDEKVENVIRNGKLLVEERIKNKGKYRSIACWLNLLGFRKNMDLANWDVDDKDVQLGLHRISVLHETALISMNERYEIVNMNDAVVVARDITKGNEATECSEFLALIDLLFEIATKADIKIGGYGVRGVVCKGSRFNLRGNLGWVNKDKPKEEPSFFSPRPIMMNMAFARAYGVESSKKLLKEPSLYIESEIIFEYKPAIMETWSLDTKLSVDGFGQFLLVRKE